MIQNYRPEFGALNCPLLCRLSGPLDAGRLQRAMDALTARHESLRTTFAGRGKSLTQRIHPPRPLPLVVVDLAGPRAGADLTAAIGAELANPIDTTVWPARATLWRIADTRHVLCLNLHHLVTDAWSTGILLRDLCAAYGDEAPLAPPGWQYGEFVGWQQRTLSGDQLHRHHDYWRRQLTGGQTPRLWSEPARDTEPQRVAIPTDLAPALVTRLREVARRHRTTLFTVLLAAFYAELHRATGQSELAVGSMFANRSRPELRETVGLLANMVLLRTQISRARSFTDLINQTHAAVIGAFAYQDLPFQMLPTGLLDIGGGRADDVVFNVMADVQHTISAGGLEFELLVPDEIGSRFRFELALAPIGTQDMRAVLFHAGGNLSEDACREFLTGYVATVDALTADPGRPIGSAGLTAFRAG